MYRGPVMDTHVHLQLDDGMRVAVGDHRPEDYLGAVGRTDLFAVGVLVMAPEGDLERTRKQNDLVLELASQPPWYAMCSVHPYDGSDALAELERVAEAGARGVKLHPNTQRFDVGDDRVTKVVEQAGQLGLPVLFDAYSPFDADQPGKFVTLAMSCPEARLVLAHMHGPRFPELVVYDVLGRYEWWPGNVWHDLSFAAAKYAESPFHAQFRWACDQVGLDRLLYGSDYPLDDPKQALGSMSSLFDDDEIGRVVYGNAAELYSLTRRPATSGEAASVP